MDTSTRSDRPTWSAGPSRRDALQLLLAAAGMLVAGGVGAEPPARPMRERRIPGTGEALPVIGLGTWRTFDVGRGAEERAPLTEVLRRFVKLGGRLIDSSPMYGAAEAVVGDLAAGLGLGASLFLATKVWTRGRQEGIRQMDASRQRLRAERIDLMQVHNLVDWRTQLKTLREWKEAGKIRYLGVTHYTVSAFGDIEQIIKTEKLDFVEVPFSIANREAEQRLLPAAAERGTAVIAHSPFEGGGLFGKVRGRPLPPWAADFDCQSWAQFFLKYIVAHGAVTCAIPATSKPEHLVDNMQAGMGRLPDEAQRRRMLEVVARL